MPTAAFTTLGCKVNQYETQRILDDFEERGFAITEFNTPADIYVINTCSVTQAAERKSRYMVRKVARQNPDAIVVMTGCYGEMAKIKGEEVEDAALVVPNHLKLQTLQQVLTAYPNLVHLLDSAPRVQSERPFVRRTRATIKVQDGCNVFCSFCSIPYTRKVMFSRPLDEIVSEAEAKAAQGYKELVVTGVLVGAYGRDNVDFRRGSAKESLRVINQQEPDLADVLIRLTQVPGIERVRLSSIEPTQVTDRLLNAFANEQKLCRHLHIPLQSGDSEVLAAMNRPYDQEFYLDRCRAAYDRIPDLAITSDIMVGFPGEDRAAFESTLKVVDEVGYARAHLFRYSPRPGTPAAERKDQISEPEKEARSKELGDACRTAQQRFIQQYLGRTMEVLIEGRAANKQLEENVSADGASGNDGRMKEKSANIESPQAHSLLHGYTSNYIRVQLTGGSHLLGTVVPVRLIEPTSDGALGEAGGAHFSLLEAPDDAEFIPLAVFSAAI